jgi:hypothetical protein
MVYINFSCAKKHRPGIRRQPEDLRAGQRASGRVFRIGPVSAPHPRSGRECAGATPCSRRSDRTVRPKPFGVEEQNCDAPASPDAVAVWQQGQGIGLRHCP